MKVIPRKISNITLLSTQPNNGYGLYIKSEDENLLLMGILRETADPEVLNTLVKKYAYASALLYFVENFILTSDVSSKDLLEDINVLLHDRCIIVEEQAPLLTKINDYPIYESEDYIIRGEGKKKIKESFNLEEDIDINDITADFMKHREYDKPIKDYVKCEKCGNVFHVDDIETVYDNIAADAGEELIAGYRCPWCGMTRADKDSFSTAWLDDLEDAPNRGEYIQDINNLSSDSSPWMRESTQAADIAAKVDYNFQSAPTSVSPRKKRYESVEIDKAECPSLSLKGFIKDIDGYYKRGNYVVVKESATGKIKVVHESEVESKMGAEYVKDYVRDRLDLHFPNRFIVESVELDEAYGIRIKDTKNHQQIDLIDITDFINAIMKSLRYEKSDYEIDYNKDSLILAIYDKKLLYSNEMRDWAKTSQN